MSRDDSDVSVSISMIGRTPVDDVNIVPAERRLKSIIRLVANEVVPDTEGMLKTSYGLTLVWAPWLKQFGADLLQK